MRVPHDSPRPAEMVMPDPVASGLSVVHIDQTFIIKAGFREEVT